VSLLSDVDRIIVPGQAVDLVLDHLRLLGNRGFEGVGFWVGQVRNREAVVEAAFIPRQTTGETDTGLVVVIEGDELFRMNVILHKHGWVLVAQVHSHPGEAYHSETDDDLAVVSQVGGLSIVIPDFARRGFTLEEAAVYRRVPGNTWVELSPVQAKLLIDIRR